LHINSEYPLQGHADLVPPPTILFDFERGQGEVPVVGWSQMLTALTKLVEPFVQKDQDLTTKLKRLWAYELQKHDGIH
jgi:hypothetical protein